jgi:predicted AAA+ superfamily ATPase
VASQRTLEASQDTEATFHRFRTVDGNAWAFSISPAYRLFGALLESFVFSQLLKLSAWTEERVMLFHYRDRDQLKVDFVLENSAGGIIGIEVK